MSFLMLEKEQVYMHVYTYVYIYIYVLNFKHDLLSMRILRVFAPSDDGKGAGIYGCLYIYVYMYVCVEFQARSTKDAYARLRPVG